MFDDFAAVGDHLRLLKRAMEDHPTTPNPANLVLPTWVFWLFLAEFVLFVPGFLCVGYTLNYVYPVLAVVEDPNPPEYDPLALHEPSDPAEFDAVPTDARVPRQPVTTSLRKTHRLLRSTGGWRANFRGLGCALAIVFVNTLAGLFFGAFVPSFFGTLLASLATVQWFTAWVHMVISAPPAAGEPRQGFWHRLPPLQKTFEATWAAVLAHWATTTVSRYVPLVLLRALGTPLPGSPGEPMPMPDASAAWKVPLVFCISLALWAFAVVPTQVLLVRVQASLLPPDQHTIVPFDRSFQGRVQPAVIDGKGYATMRDAWVTFPTASWIRLYLLYAKVWLVGILFYALFAMVFVPQMLLFATTAENQGL